MKRFCLVVCSALYLVLSLAYVSYAEVPGAINYQGRLMNSSGIPVTTDVTVKFTFWDSEIDGNILGRGWSDSDLVSPNTEGLYSTDIGDHPGNLIPSNVFAMAGVWLDISVNDNSLIPRTRMLNVPYAFHADQADTAIASQTALTANRLSGSGLTNPGDVIQLGDNVQLAVTADGQIEFQVNSEYYRLVKKKWLWNHPQYLNEHISPAGENASYPLVATDNSGNIIITWIQSDGEHNQLFMSEYRNGAWTHPTDLGDNISPDGQDVYLAGSMVPDFRWKSSDLYSLAMDNNGNTIIVWAQTDGSNYQIFKSEYRNGSWTHPSGLTDNISPNGQDAQWPQVAMSDDGTAMIVWQQSDGLQTQIFRSTYLGGLGNWAHPSGLSDNISISGQNAFAPKVVMDDSGNAIIVWIQSDGSNNHVYKSQYRRGIPFSQWSSPANLADHISPGGGSAVLAQVAMDGSGDAIIAWEQSNGTEGRIYTSEYRSGEWTHPTDLNDTFSFGSSRNVHAAMSNNGSAVITWEQWFSDNLMIYSSHYLEGAWNSHLSSYPRSISPADTNTVLPYVVLNDLGNAIVTWFDYDTTAIYKGEYRQQTWLHPTGTHDAVSSGQSYYPQASIDNDGNITLVWMQSTGTENHIFKSEYRLGFEE